MNTTRNETSSSEPAIGGTEAAEQRATVGQAHFGRASDRRVPDRGAYDFRYEALRAPDDSWHVFDAATELPAEAADGALIGLDRWTALAVARHLNTGKPGLATFRARGGRLIVVSN